MLCRCYLAAESHDMPYDKRDDKWLICRPGGSKRTCLVQTLGGAVYCESTVYIERNAQSLNALFQVPKCGFYPSHAGVI